MKRLSVSLLLTAFVAAFFAVTVIQARSYPLLARLYPLGIGIPAFLLALVQLVREFKGESKSGDGAGEVFGDIAADSSVPSRTVYLRSARQFGWLIVLILASWVVGFKVAVPLYSMFFFRLEGKIRWVFVALLGAVAIFALQFEFEHLLYITWPAPLLTRWVESPWVY